jgi:hypothetical protein
MQMDSSSRPCLFEDGLSLEECLQRVQVLFYDENTNTDSILDLSYIDELLSRLEFDNDESSTVIKNIASFVRDVATYHPNACHLLLIHLPNFRDPIPLINIMPSMFCVASPSLVAAAVTQLKLLPIKDSKYLLPVIGIIADLPLTDGLLEELYGLGESAIDTLEESELPALFRILMKSVCPSRAERALLKIRDEVGIVNHTLHNTHSLSYFYFNDIKICENTSTHTDIYDVLRHKLFTK